MSSIFLLSYCFLSTYLKDLFWCTLGVSILVLLFSELLFTLIDIREALVSLLFVNLITKGGFMVKGIRSLIRFFNYIVIKVVDLFFKLISVKGSVKVEPLKSSMDIAWREVSETVDIELRKKNVKKRLNKIRNPLITKIDLRSSRIEYLNELSKQLNELEA